LAHHAHGRSLVSRGWRLTSALLLLACALGGILIGLHLRQSGAAHHAGRLAVGSHKLTFRLPTKLHSTAAPTTSTTVTTAPSAAGELSGKIIVIDPGHNGDNYQDPTFINALIWNGREMEACDTTGTETGSGYTEAQFNFNVAQYLASDLEAAGARVVLTRTTNSGVGPCVTQRAAIGNNAHADAAVSIHADGGSPGGRGFSILEPVADGPNNDVIAQSAELGADIRSAFLAANVEPISDYYGTNGIQPRDDLAGLNLTTVPKILVECANMQNLEDAALVVTPAFQQAVSKVLAAGITQFVTSS
jgi:N-acetylmuramoyl-L-alanine amidase